MTELEYLTKISILVFLLPLLPAPRFGHLPRVPLQGSHISRFSSLDEVLMAPDVFSLCVWLPSVRSKGWACRHAMRSFMDLHGTLIFLCRRWIFRGAFTHPTFFFPGGLGEDWVTMSRNDNWWSFMIHSSFVLICSYHLPYFISVISQINPNTVIHQTNGICPSSQPT